MANQTSAVDHSLSEGLISNLPSLYQTSQIQSGLGNCIEHSHNSLAQKLKTICNRLLSTTFELLKKPESASSGSWQITEIVSEVFTRQNGPIQSNPVDETSSNSILSASSNDEGDENTEAGGHAQGGLDEFAKSSDEILIDTSDDSDDSDDVDDSKLPAANNDDIERGIIYVRESDISSVEDGRNLDGQIEECKQTAKDEGIELVCEPITDEGKTGTNFDREGIREVFVKAQRNVDYLIVDDLSRLGRSAPETLYFIHYMEDTVGVTIMTPRGEINAS